MFAMPITISIADIFLNTPNGLQPQIYLACRCGCNVDVDAPCKWAMNARCDNDNDVANNGWIADRLISTTSTTVGYVDVC